MPYKAPRKPTKEEHAVNRVRGIIKRYKPALDALAEEAKVIKSATQGLTPGQEPAGK